MSLKPHLREVGVANDLHIGDYKTFDPATYRQIIAAAKPLRGTPIIHVNSTAQGGGVAELLKSRVPFERALGLQSRWFAIEAEPLFFSVTKRIHNLLQGKPGVLFPWETAAYLGTNALLRSDLHRILGQGGGIVVFHDPQPLPLIQSVPENWEKVSRLHIDLSAPNRSALALILPFVREANRIIVSHKDYIRPLAGVPQKKISVIYPAIDPLSPKNRPLSPESALRLLENFGIDASRPLLTQVSRFDPWKDPLGVIEAYYIAKNKVPNLELVLAGFESAADDPQARKIFAKVKKYAKGDPSIHLFSDPRTLKDVSSDVFVSALYAASAVVVQKSLREGFGLTVTEAMWKGKAVVAGRTRGTSLQITSGGNGLIVSSSKAAAAAVVRLVKDEKLRSRLGRAAQASVRKKFLLPRLILDNLKVYTALKAK